MSQGNSTTYNHTLTQAQLDKLQIAHHEQVMKHNSNQVKTSAAQAYANTINNGSTGRTFATQSHSYTNPNTLNLQRWGYTATNNGGQLVCGNNTNNYEEDIQTNADNIAQNTTDIATNTTDIATNTTDIVTNTTDIATNTEDIATNTTNIATNTTNIATNTEDIATNTTNIAQNTEDIVQNTEDIAQNTTNIATSTTNIATNTTNIAIITNNIATIPSIYETIENASLLAPKESPVLTGIPTTTTPAAGDNSTQIANTGWVLNEISSTIASPSVYKTYHITGSNRNYNIPITLTADDNPTETINYMVFVTYYSGFNGNGNGGTYTVSTQSAIFGAEGNLITNRKATEFTWNFWNGPDGDNKNMIVCFRIDFLTDSQIDGLHYPVSWD